MNAVELKNVSFAYKDNVILNDVNFYADYGTITCIFGSSGSGKSTLMNIISGIIPNVIEGNLSGRVLINGENIKNKKLGELSHKVGVVLQNADEQIIQKIVEDEIAFGCENFAFPKEKTSKQIDIVCNLLKLDKSQETRCLSGGEKQRLLIASILAMGQKIIILDEPLANLDKKGSIFLMENLAKLAKAQYLIIVIEHRLDIVLPYADKVYHIENSKIEEVLDKKEYLKNQTRIIKNDILAPLNKEVLFSLKHAKYKVKDKEILKDITFDIYKGERLLILGENGCGKTTLIRLIAKLNKLSLGEMTQYLDKKLKQKKKGNKKWFKKVGIIYQNPDYQLFMPTVKKEIEFQAISKEYANKIGELFNIKNIWNRHPQSLSEGQKRRVSIAAVCATKPEVLLLDEPTVGQDYEGLKNLVEILNKLHKETNNTMITITHDIRCAEALSDRVILIENGIISKTGNKEIINDFFK